MTLRKSVAALLLVAAAGCASLPPQEQLRADVKYELRGSHVEVLAVSSNFERIRKRNDTFSLGFRSGFEEVLKRQATGIVTLTAIHFRESEDDRLYAFGYETGFREAERFLKSREPNQAPQRNAGSRPSSGDSPAAETPSSLGPRG